MSSSSSSVADDVTAIILAGGRATRMGGIAKHAIVVEGRTILARQLDALAAIERVIVSSPKPIPDMHTVEDSLGEGPLAGIFAALGEVTTRWALVVACDLPYLTPQIVDLLLRSRDREAVGIRIGDLPEPLLCALRVAPARTALERRLRERRYKASQLFDDLDTVWLDEAQVRNIDPMLRSLHNVNRFADLP